MTDQELINYYADLLRLQYKPKPKAYATIQTVVEPVIMDQLPVAVQNAFSVDTAVGVQLDAVGKYCGVTRDGYGVDGPISLDDDEFRTLIRMAIITNNSGSSLATIQDFLFQFFPGEIYVFDYQNMRMSYLIDADVGSIDLIQMMVNQNLLPRPMAVGLSVIYLPVVTNAFGFVTYQQPNSFLNHGFNTYDDYDMDCPWISYQNAIL